MVDFLLSMNLYGPIQITVIINQHYETTFCTGLCEKITPNSSKLTRSCFCAVITVCVVLSQQPSLSPAPATAETYRYEYDCTEYSSYNDAGGRAGIKATVPVLFIICATKCHANNLAGWIRMAENICSELFGIPLNNVLKVQSQGVLMV